MATRTLLLVALTGSAACADVKLRPEDSNAIWNFTPAQPLDNVASGLNDPVLAVCCPREGGDLFIDMYVTKHGTVLEPRVARPQGPTGVAAGLACAGMSVVVWLEGDDVEAATQHQNESMLQGCEDGRAVYGGSYFFPPAIPEASQRCIERILGAKSVDATLSTTPAFVRLHCAPNPAR